MTMADGSQARFVIAVEDVSGLWPTVKTVSAPRALVMHGDSNGKVLNVAYASQLLEPRLPFKNVSLRNKFGSRVQIDELHVR